MTRHLLFALSLIASITFGHVIADRCACAQTAKGRSKESVIVSIRPVSIVNSPIILMSDIARIESRDLDLKANVENLDIADAPVAGEVKKITPSLVEYRLRMAGIDVQRMTIVGTVGEVSIPDARTPPHQVSKNRDLKLARNETLSPRSSTGPNLTTPREIGQRETSVRTNDSETRTIEEMMIAVGRKCILEQLPWNQDEVSIRVVQPVSRDDRISKPIGKALITAECRGTGAPLGRVVVEVTIERPNEPAMSASVAFDVRHFETVVAARKAIPKGHEIRMDDLYVRSTDVTGSADYCTEASKLVGTVARRAIPALQLVRDQDVEGTSAGTGTGNSIGTGQGRGNPIVIKRQDRVKLVAKIGDLSITVSGEAQQDGRVGEIIRVLNVESKAVVAGRVLRANEVEIIE